MKFYRIVVAGEMGSVATGWIKSDKAPVINQTVRIFDCDYIYLDVLGPFDERTDTLLPDWGIIP